VPPALRLAAVLVAIQVTAGIVVVLTGDRYGPGGRVATAGVLALGYAFARSAARLQAGGALGVLMFEVSAVLVVLGASGWPAGARAGVAASAVAVVVLVLASLRAFPTPSVPVR
jgi:hypothetical protein